MASVELDLRKQHSGRYIRGDKHGAMGQFTENTEKISGSAERRIMHKGGFGSGKLLERSQRQEGRSKKKGGRK